MSRIFTIAAAAALGLSACTNLTSDQNFAAGGLAGGAAGLAAADALDADGTGRAIGTLAGAAIGSSVAANRSSSDRPLCRYPDGSVSRCPIGR